jgi:hypothetical protein
MLSISTRNYKFENEKGLMSVVFTEQPLVAFGRLFEPDA